MLINYAKITSIKYDIVGSVVIYNESKSNIYNICKDFFDTCLHVKLYVIDNSPVEKNRSLIEGIGENIVYIFNNNNIGFGAAHNIAISNSSGMSNYYVVLNPDIRFNKDVLLNLSEYMDKNTGVALSMPKILYQNGDIQYLCKHDPTPFILLVRRFFPSFLKYFFKNKLTHYEMRDCNYEQQFNPETISGCFMFFRSKILSKVGGFDERYFMYMEDVDLCRKIREYHIISYNPTCTVTHYYRKGSYKEYKLLKYHIKSVFRYFNKWGW